MENLEIYDVVIVPLIVAGTEAATRIGMPKKFAPALAVGLGVVIGIVYIAPGNIPQGIIVGAAAGLAAVGLYSGTKNTIQKK